MNRCIIVAAVFTLALGAADVASSQPSTSQQRVVPRAPITHPSRAQVFGDRVIDIPQSAKDAGHNGGVTWTAAVTAEGTLSGLTLKDSSKSNAIDAAARLWAEQARYGAATDSSGTKIAGIVDVHLNYSAWDPDNGGSLATYRCAELVRDADWFAAANAGRQRIFWLENAFTSLPSLRLMQQGVLQNRAEREAGRAKALKDWKAILGRCRRLPDKVFLELVEDREFYRGLVESF